MCGRVTTLTLTVPKYQIIVEAPELGVLVHGEDGHVIGQLVFTGGDLLLFNTSRWIDGPNKSRDLLDVINVTWTGCQLVYQPLLAVDAVTSHVLSNLAVVAAFERVYSCNVLTPPHLSVNYVIFVKHSLTMLIFAGALYCLTSDLCSQSTAMRCDRPVIQ